MLALGFRPLDAYGLGAVPYALDPELEIKFRAWVLWFRVWDGYLSKFHVSLGEGYSTAFRTSN